MSPLGDLSRVDGELIGTLQLQEKTTITGATSDAGGYRNHQPPHRPGLHLELATQGIERTKRSAGSPNRLIGRAILHSAGTGGKLSREAASRLSPQGRGRRYRQADRRNRHPAFSQQASG